MSANPTLVVRLAGDDCYVGDNCTEVAKRACKLPVLAAQWSHPQDHWDGTSWPRHTLSPADRDIVRDATVLFSYGHSLPAELTAALLDIIGRAAA